MVFDSVIFVDGQECNHFSYNFLSELQSLIYDCDGFTLTFDDILKCIYSVSLDDDGSLSSYEYV